MDLDEHDVRMNGLDDEENDEDEELEQIRRRRLEDDEDDEDDDEEDDEEDEDGGRSSRKHKRRRRDAAANPYIDLQATVDDDEEDDDEDEEAEAGFLQYQQQEEDDDDDAGPDRAAAHARLDRQRLHEQELSGEELARRLKERYARNDQAVEELSSVPQRMLMPSVNDPNLWQIKVKTGRERDIVLSLYRKTLDLEFKANPLQIISAFERTSLPGYVYVEARSKEAVINACANLVGIFRKDPILVPINEMAPLLQLKQKEVSITPGMWVRIKRGKYQGDLAEVVDITDNGEEAGIRFLPRIDMNRDADADGKSKRKRTTTAVGRPPARPFNPEEVLRVYGKKQVIKKGPSWIFQGDTFTNGFIEKDVRVSALVLENVNPTLSEIAMFAGQGKDGQDKGIGGALNLAALAEAAKRSSVVALQPGDQVEVYQGEQSGAQGVVDSVLGDIVHIRGLGLDLEGQTIEVPAKYVRKRFSPGEHVKVMSGQNTDETGMVVSVKGDHVTFISDLTEEEVTVFSKDLRTAAEVGSGSNVVGNYELHDLVQLDSQTVGVIYRTERDSFRVLDQYGQTRLVQPHQITMRRDSRRAVSTDAEGNELRVGDNVKEIDGENRRGVVLHIHQAFFAFLHNREITQDGGIFVTRCRSLAPIAPKGAPKPGTMDLTKMNPAVAGGQGGAPSMSKGPRDRLINVRIKIIKGPQKGYQGVIKDVNGAVCRVELSTNNRIINIDKEKLRRLGPDGRLEPLEGPAGFAHPGAPRGAGSSGGSGGGGGGGGGWGASPAPGRTPNPYNTDGGRTPGWGASGRTPNPYADRRTPAWSASTNTPNPYLDSNKTPSWNASSRTPNPYAGSGSGGGGWGNDGGRTPGWNAASRTPNPYNSSGGGSGSGSGSGGGWGNNDRTTPSWDSSSKTPTASRGGGGGWGSSNNSRDGGWGTPAESSWNKKNGSSTPANGDSRWGSSNNNESSSRSAWDNDNDTGGGWGETAPTPAAVAPTPYQAAPTPYISAPTPNTFSAPTPVVSAPTPAPYSSETPAIFAAPTPAVPAFTPSGYAAATPAAVAQTPGLSHDYARPFREAPFRADNKKWLLEFKISGLCARIKEDSGWALGKYDLQNVSILTVIEKHDHLTSMAQVKILDGDNVGWELEVPIHALQPLHPFGSECKDRSAILLQNHYNHGLMKGSAMSGAKMEKVKLRSYIDQEWLCERSEVPGAADIEVPATDLCLLE